MSKEFDVCLIGNAATDYFTMNDGVTFSRSGGVAYSLSVLCQNELKTKVISYASKEWVQSLEANLGLKKNFIEWSKELIKNKSEAEFVLSNCDEVLFQSVKLKRKTLANESEIIKIVETTKSKVFIVFPQENVNLLTLVKKIRETNPNSQIYLDMQHDLRELTKDEVEEVLSIADVIFVSLHEFSVEMMEKGVTNVFDFLVKCNPAIFIIKNGYGGLCYKEKGNNHVKIPAFMTDYKCTIGAGDVFCAAFLVCKNKGMNSSEAAEVAQFKTSMFIKNMSMDFTDLLIDNFVNEKSNFKNLERRIYVPINENEKLKIYLASNFKSDANKMYVDFIDNLLCLKGFSCLSPSRINGVLSNVSSLDDKKNTFEKDINLLKEADVLLLLADTAEMGSCWEAGYFYSMRGSNKGKLITLFTNSTKNLSNMIKQSSITVRDYKNLIEELFKKAERLKNE